MQNSAGSTAKSHTLLRMRLTSLSNSSAIRQEVDAQHPCALVESEIDGNLEPAMSLSRPVPPRDRDQDRGQPPRAGRGGMVRAKVQRSALGPCAGRHDAAPREDRKRKSRPRMI